MVSFCWVPDCKSDWKLLSFPWVGNNICPGAESWNTKCWRRIIRLCLVTQSGLGWDNRRQLEDVHIRSLPIITHVLLAWQQCDGDILDVDIGRDMLNKTPIPDTVEHLHQTYGNQTHCFLQQYSHSLIGVSDRCNNLTIPTYYFSR